MERDVHTHSKARCWEMSEPQDKDIVLACRGGIKQAIRRSSRGMVEWLGHLSSATLQAGKLSVAFRVLGDSFPL